MAMKRKRSCAAFSSSADNIAPSFCQWSDSPLRLPLYFPQSKLIDVSRVDISRDWKIQHEIESPHLNSRTRKRYRDNRPDEEQIYGMSFYLHRF